MMVVVIFVQLLFGLKGQNKGQLYKKTWGLRKRGRWKVLVNVCLDSDSMSDQQSLDFSFTLF